MKRIIPVTLLAALVSFPASAPAARQEPPVIANGSKGSLRELPELILRATPGTDGPDEALLYEPNSVYFGPDGRVYIGDDGHTAIQVYDRAGTYLFSFGGKGAGPGEFQFIQGVFRGPEGDLVAPDLMNRRINYFSPDGEFLRSTPLNGDLLRGDVLVPTGGGEYLRGGGVSIAVARAASTGPPKEDEGEPALVEIVNAANEVVRSFGERKPAEDATLDAVLNNIVTATGGGKVAAGFKVSDDIRIYDVRSGRLERIITRRLPFRAQEPVIKERDVDIGDGRTVRVNSVITDTVTRALAYDPAGRLWVITALHGTDRTKELEEEGDYGQISRLEVYAPDGRLLCILPLEEPATRLYFDPQGDLWMLDSQYNATVRRFEVRWP